MKTSASELDPVEELAEAFLARYRRGERPAVSEYTDKYPELAEKIRDLFPALVMMEELGSVANQATGPDTSRRAEITQVPQQLGEYRILRQVGRGGMGVVYEAVQESLGRHVALKTLPYHRLTNPQLVERFHREARAAARLHHTNIVPVFGVGEHEGIQYYAMQFIQGHSLDVVLKEIRRLRSGKASFSKSSPPPPGEMTEAREELTLSLAHGLLTGDFHNPGGAAMAGGGSHDPGDRGVHTPRSPLSPGHPAKPSSSVIEKDQTSDVHSQVAFLDAHLVKDGQSDLTSVSRGNYFRRVAMIGLQVADGLSYAHSQDVLHRDIKPSNLMLDTRGTVWITDFGLAKSEGSDELTQPGDIVGTMRYMAPERFEGRADARSDVYSLGMTLYELLTLHPAFEDTNRARLIKRIAQEQPARPGKLDTHTPRDLETIVLKAIAKEPADRYQTTAEFAEDLKRFLADRPIKARRSSFVERSWRWCRRNPSIATLAASVAILLVTVAAVSSVAAFWLRQEENATKNQLALTIDAKREATHQLYNSLAAQARARRWSGRRGQRFESLEALKKAADLLPSLDLGPEALLELRNDAIAAMVLPDLRGVKDWDGNPHGTSGVAFDAELERYARSDGQGNISIRRVADDQEITNLTGPGEPAWMVQFSPNGRYLTAKYHRPNMNHANEGWVWDLKLRERVLRSPWPITAMHFSPDSRWLAMGFLVGTVNVYDLNSEKKELIGGLPQGPITEHFCFHPDCQRLTLARNQSVLLWDFGTGKLETMFTLPGNVLGISWHPEGKLLAAVSGKNAIQIWNAITGQFQSELKGHQGGGVGCVFSHDGDVLVSNSWDGTVRLWDPWTGQQLLNSAQGGLHLSRDDHLMGGYAGSRVGLWEVALGRECRKLAAPVEVGNGPWSADFSPDLPLLASAHEHGVRLWDLRTWKEIVFLEMSGCQSAVFDPKGKRLITTGVKGARLWETRWKSERPEEILEIGPPQILPETVGCLITRASWSADGGTLAVIDSSHAQAIVFDVQSDPIKVLFRYRHPYIANIVLSLDGQWVASATWSDPLGTVKVFDLRQQKQVKEFKDPNSSRFVQFSPDGKWLVIGNRVWRTGSWIQGDTINTSPYGVMPKPVAFSADGKVLALAPGGLSAQPVRLLDFSTGQELATLALPYPEWVKWLCFSPDGSQLAACCTEHGLRVWDLRSTRQQLADMGLDWNLPPYPPAKSSSQAKPLQVKVDLGNHRG